MQNFGNERLKFRYTNKNGDSILIANDVPYIYLSQTGMDSMTSSPSLIKAPFQIGKTNFGNVINERTITLKFALISETEEENEILRRNIIKAFNPLIPGDLNIYGNSFQRCFQNVSVTSTPKFNDSNYQVEMQLIMECQVSMCVPQGFLSDLNDTQVELTRVIPMIEFPFEKQIGEMFEVGTLSFGGINYENEADAPSSLIIEIFGPVKTPTIKNNTTGEFIKVHTPILAGERMIIDTSFTNKSVKIINENGVERNAFHYIDIDSTFFQLEKGMNNIEFDAEEGNDKARVMMYFRRMWTGI